MSLCVSRHLKLSPRALGKPQTGGTHFARKYAHRTSCVPHARSQGGPVLVPPSAGPKIIWS